jgi:non-ribosomal peptide synthetase component E (peptide arylation enzyme)
MLILTLISSNLTIRRHRMWDTSMPVEPSRRAEYYERGWWRRETFLDDLRQAARDRPDAAAVIA